MPKKLNILVVSPGFPSSEEDSSCLPALRMFLNEALLREQTEISVISLQYPFEATTYTCFGLPVQAMGGKNKKGISRLFLFIRTWKAMKKSISQPGEKILLSVFATDAALLSSWFAKLHGLTHYCWMMGQDAKKSNRFMPWIHKSTQFMVMSEFMKKEAETNYGIRVSLVLPSALNLNELPPFEKPVKEFDFICVGSLIPLKRTAWVLEILKRLSDEGQTATCLIVGDGPERKHLENLSLKYNLQDRVYFAGALPHREVIQSMFKSRIFLHPSSYEGFGTVLIEGLYAACEVLSCFDPLNGSNPQLHHANAYEAFYRMAKQLLLQKNESKSYRDYTSENSVRLFLNFLKG